MATTFRVYYNQTYAWPFVWSVDDGDQAHEQTCEDVVVSGCYWRTHALSPEARGRVDSKTVPTAWIEVYAEATERVDNKIIFVPPSVGH
jgi:hypothetical protein